jgi:cytochrome c oxidase subunit III
VTRRTVDVSKLPTYAFGSREPMWWAVMLLVAIEGTMLVLLAISYFYVRARTTPFPPTHVGRTAAWIGTAELAVWVASIAPMALTARAARAADLQRMRRWIIITTLFGIVAVTLRILEYHWLPFRWDDHAYGSVVWSLLGVQWLHGVTGVLEDLLFVVLLFVGPVEQKHRVDIEITAPLWYFVVAGAALVWAVVFADVFLGGRA